MGPGRAVGLFIFIRILTCVKDSVNIDSIAVVACSVSDFYIVFD